MTESWFTNGQTAICDSHTKSKIILKRPYFARKRFIFYIFLFFMKIPLRSHAHYFLKAMDYYFTWPKDMLTICIKCLSRRNQAYW